MLDLEKMVDKTVQVKFDGKVHDLRKPTIGDRQVFDKITKEKGEDEAAKEFLVILGMCENSVLKLNAEHISLLIEEIGNTKKK